MAQDAYLTDNPESADIARQRKLAEMLTLQAFQQPQGGLVSGHYVAPSWTQQLAPLVSGLAGQQMNKKLDEKQLAYAQLLRQKGIEESAQILAAKNPQEQYAIALSGVSPVSQNMAQILQKKLMEGPKWEKAEMPQPDGSVKHGWVNYNSPDVKGSFVEGGTKPSYTPLEGAKFQYETGMQPPGVQITPLQNAPAQNVPVKLPQQTAPVSNAPVQTSNANIPTLIHPSNGALMPPADVKSYADRNTNGDIAAAINILVNRQGFGIKQNAPVQNAPIMSNALRNQPNQSALMSAQVVNQPITSSGNAVPVSAMNAPGMSPKDRSEANKQIYTEAEKQRQTDLKGLPNAIEQAQNAIKTVDQMIGDARLNDKGEIVYETYDPVSKKWVKSTKEEHGGFGQYVGLGVPYLSNIHGTDTASFRTLYESLKGQAFLDAFQKLKGSGQITEIEGQKATDALLKLNNAQNEKDFIKYAREFQENLQRGMELSKYKAGVSKEYKSPVNQPVLRWNPQTNSWVQQ